MAENKQFEGVEPGEVDPDGQTEEVEISPEEVAMVKDKLESMRSAPMSATETLERVGKVMDPEPDKTVEAPVPAPPASMAAGHPTALVLEPTDQYVFIDGASCRVWRGHWDGHSIFVMVRSAHCPARPKVADYYNVYNVCRPASAVVPTTPDTIWKPPLEQQFPGNGESG